MDPPASHAFYSLGELLDDDYYCNFMLRWAAALLTLLPSIYDLLSYYSYWAMMCSMLCSKHIEVLAAAIVLNSIVDCIIV